MSLDQPALSWSDQALGAIARVRGFGERFWSWWNGELRQLVPERLRQALDRRRGRWRIDVLADDMVWVEICQPGLSSGGRPWTAVLPFQELGDLVNRQPSLAGTRMPVDVVISSCFVLDHMLSLPAAAKSHFSQAVSLQLERVMPLTSDAIYHAGCRQEADEDDRIRAHVRAVRRDRVDDILRRLAGNGVRVRHVLLASSHTDGTALPIAGVARPQGPAAFGPWFVVVLAGLAGVLFWSSLMLYTAKLDRSAAAFRQQIGEVRGQAERTVVLRAQLRELIDRGAFLRQELGRPSAVRVLAQLTEAVPDGAWVSEFRLQGEQVRLVGAGRDPGGLIGRLEAMPLFEDVRLVRVFDDRAADRGQRFEVSLTLAGGGGR